MRALFNLQSSTGLGSHERRHHRRQWRQLYITANVDVARSSDA